MASTYVNNLRLNEMGTGDQSGTWGTVTNTNLELIGDALGYGTQTLLNASTATSNVSDGSSAEARAMYLKYSGTLSATCTITITPNTMKRVQIIENATSGGQSIIIKQGSGATVTIPNGTSKICVLDGAGAGAAVIDGLQNLAISGDLTVGGDDLKMATNTSGHVLVGDGTNYNPVAMSGDATIAANGAITIANDAVEQAMIADDAVGADQLASNAVVDASIASGAAIDATKIANGSVTSTEFQYINTLSSNAQTQLDAKLGNTVNTWHNSSDGRNRFYFSNNGETYIKYDSYLYITNNSGDTKTSIDTSGNFITEGNVTAYGTASDIALKENVSVIDNALEKVNQLKGITYDLKSDGNRLTGLVAQDLQEVLPEAVYKTKNVKTEEEHLAIRYGNTVGLLVEAIKDLSKQVEELKNGSTN